MGAQLSAATREVSVVLVSVLDAQPLYRASLVATLRRYQSDADIPPSQALQWTSEKLCKDLSDPLVLQHAFAQQLGEAAAQSPHSALLGLDKASLSSCVSRAAMLVLEELKLDLAVHARLFECAAEGRLDRVRRLQPFVDVEYTDAQGATVLMLAAHYGHGGLVAYLLSLQPPPSVDAQDQYGWTALMHAARNGHLACARLLTAHSAAVDKFNASRCSALMCAADNGHYAVVRHLLGLQAEVDAVSRSGDTALLQAAKGGHLSCMKALVAAGAHVSHVGKKQQSAVMTAASQARWDIVEYLVSEGAAVDGVDDEGRSLCHYEVQPALQQPLDATGRGGALTATGGGQLAAAIQRGIVGRFNRTIQRAVEPVVHRQLGAFRRQQLSNGHIAQQTHSPQRAADRPAVHAAVARVRRDEGERAGSTTAEEDDEREEAVVDGSSRAPQSAETARLTHTRRAGRPRSGASAGVGENGAERWRRQRRVSRRQRRDGDSSSKVQGDTNANVSVGTVVLGEDDEDELHATHSKQSTAAASLSPSLSSHSGGDLAVRAGERRLRSHSLTAPAAFDADVDVDLDADIDDDALLLLAGGIQRERQSPVGSARAHRKQQPAVSPTAQSGQHNSSAASALLRPVHPTPRQAGQRNGASHTHLAVSEEEEKEPRHTAHSRATIDDASRSHHAARKSIRELSTLPRRLRSDSSSPPRSLSPSRRSRPSAQSRLAALRQATFLPTSAAARALRLATEGGEDSGASETEKDGDELRQRVQQSAAQHSAGEEQRARAEASSSSSTRVRKGSHHSIQHSPVSVYSLSPASSLSRGDSTAQSDGDSSSSSYTDTDVASQSSSSTRSSSTADSSDSETRTSPVRPLHSRSSTTSFRSVFASRAHSQTQHSPALPDLASLPPSPPSPSAASLGSSPDTGADEVSLTVAIHHSEPPAPTTATAAASASRGHSDSDNIHLNPTPQPSPHPAKGEQAASAALLRPSSDSDSHSHTRDAAQHRRAHSQPLMDATATVTQAQRFTASRRSGGAAESSERDAETERLTPPPRRQPTPTAPTQPSSLTAHAVEEGSDIWPHRYEPVAAQRAANDDALASATTQPAAELSSNSSPLAERQPLRHRQDGTPTTASTATASSSASTAAAAAPRPPPPIVLAHSDWRAHLDSTPVPAWLQHYRVEGAAYQALCAFNFRQLYSLSEEDCRRMLGRRKGELLFACSRDYARKVQASYAARNRPARHSQQQQQPQQYGAAQQLEPASLQLAAPVSPAEPQRSKQRDATGGADVWTGDRSELPVRERGRRSGRGRKRSAIHTAVIVSPPDVAAAPLVFIAPTATSAAPPDSSLAANATDTADSHTDSAVAASQPLYAPDDMSLRHNPQESAQTQSAAAGVSEGAALPPAATTSTAPPTATLSSAAVRSRSVSPAPPPLPQSSSFTALTDQLLDRSNAWLTRSVLSLFKDEPHTSHGSPSPSTGGAAAFGVGAGVGAGSFLGGGGRSSFSSAKARAHLSSILSGAGALHELDPQPF